MSIFKLLGERRGFIGIAGIVLLIVVIGIMAALLVPSGISEMRLKQAGYISGITNIIRNAEDAFMAKNGAFASLSELSSGDYILPVFVTRIGGVTTSYGSNYASTWNPGAIGNQAVTACITDATAADVSAGWTGCPYNTGTTGYFIGVYSVPVKFAEYFQHELPGSVVGNQGGGLDYIAFIAPVPSTPPTQTAPTGFFPIGTVNFTSYGYYTWTVPDGVTEVHIIVAGGGGGGGGGFGGYYDGYGYYSSGGGGGGGGASCFYISGPSAPASMLNNKQWMAAYGGNGGNGDGQSGYAGGKFQDYLPVIAGDVFNLYVGQGGYGGQGGRSDISGGTGGTRGYGCYYGYNGGNGYYPASNGNGVGGEGGDWRWFPYNTPYSSGGSPGGKGTGRDSYMGGNGVSWDGVNGSNGTGGYIIINYN